MFSPEDLRNIEILAAIIFANNRTLAGLSDLNTRHELATVLGLCSTMPGCNEELQDDTNKIYFIFREYINETTVQGIITGGADAQKYKKRNMLFLRNQAINLELQLHNLQELPADISSYIKDLIEVQAINKIILQRELQEQDTYEAMADAEKAILDLEGKIKYLQKELSNAELLFHNIPPKKSVYIKNCHDSLDPTFQLLDVLLERHIFAIVPINVLGLNFKVEAAERAENKLKRLLLKKAEFASNYKTQNESYALKTILQALHYYISAYVLIYLTTYNKDDATENNALLICQYLNYIIENFNVSICRILQIRRMSEDMAKRLFDPIVDVPPVNNPRLSNEDLCRLSDNQNSPELIIRSFRMPQNKTKYKYKHVWGTINPSMDLGSLRHRLYILSFFQNYISGQSLSTLLESKFKTQKQYISLLKLKELEKYHNYTAGNLSVKKFSELLSPKDRSKIQGYHAKLMEFITLEMQNRSGLRKAHPNIF